MSKAVSAQRGHACRGRRSAPGGWPGTSWPSRLERRELDEQVERIGEVLEGKPELTMGKVTVGEHA